ncbi:MAG: cytidine deaminase [Candidatus Cloacimonetes bacterium]|nr:cytidine deaminase [Candidatus Cloacimonadota bacterium]
MEKNKKLIAAAAKAAQNAYAPYSGFKVGAAIITGSGEIFTGCNVENASYGLTVCAERIALFNAVTAGYQNPQAIVIYTDTEIPFYPCGACRQVLAEFNPELEVSIVWQNGEENLNLADLLPKQFKL